jgi:hypothetical protein
MPLTAAQIQARLETLENQARVIINQDPSKIQPVGTVASDGYADANGIAAAANHVHPGAGGGGAVYTGPHPHVVASSFDSFLSGVTFSDAVLGSDGLTSVGDYLQGFAFCRDRDLIDGITVSDSKGNVWTMGTPVGVIGTETGTTEFGDPFTERSNTSTWVVPFSAPVTDPLRALDYIRAEYGADVGNRSFIVVRVPGCGGSGPLGLISAVGTGTAASSGMTATLPQPACFAIGLLASYFGGGATFDSTDWLSTPGHEDDTSTMTCWGETVDSTDPIEAKGTVTPLPGIVITEVGWVAILVTFAIPGGPFSLHPETAKVIYNLLDRVQQLEAKLDEAAP